MRMRVQPMVSAITVSVLWLAAACATSRPSETGESSVRDEVLATCRTFLDHYSQRRFDAVEAMLHPQAIVVMDAVDSDRQRVMTARAFLDSVRPSLEQAQSFREWIAGDATVLVDHAIGYVWAPFALEADGHHATGIDGFQLLRTGGSWQVTSIAFTSRPAPTLPESGR